MARATPAPAALRRPRKSEEDDAMRAIIEFCRFLGFLVFHDNDARRNQAGFPDLVIAGFGVVLIIELKTDTGTVTPEQRAWLTAFSAAGCDTRVYRTSSWASQDLADELKGIKRSWTRRPHHVPAPQIDVADVAAMFSRHSADPTPAGATICASYVPDLIAMIAYLKRQLEDARTVSGMA